MKNTKKGLTVISIDEKLYCAKCGMPIVNKTEWKKIHFYYHNSTYLNEV